ncbi:hypothetical protein AB6A40_007109 [Gnathostoma spinigerum]|uniref:Uncharacterized protein n=1 Tax=Gnathostoma spinigerum TaxID=75299 RepID=A0ABD6EVW8_9BILA
MSSTKSVKPTKRCDESMKKRTDQKPTVKTKPATKPRPSLPLKVHVAKKLELTNRDDIHEFEADVLDNWDQSSGTLSYDSAWSLNAQAKKMYAGAQKVFVITPFFIVFRPRWRLIAES